MISIRTRKGEELKAPRHASAATTRDDRLPYSRQILLLVALKSATIFIKKVGANAI